MNIINKITLAYNLELESVYSVVKSNQGNSSCHARLNPLSWCLAEAKIESNSTATVALLLLLQLAEKEFLLLPLHFLLLGCHSWPEHEVRLSRSCVMCVTLHELACGPSLYCKSPPLQNHSTLRKNHCANSRKNYSANSRKNYSANSRKNHSTEKPQLLNDKQGGH